MLKLLQSSSTSTHMIHSNGILIPHRRRTHSMFMTDKYIYVYTLYEYKYISNNHDAKRISSRAVERVRTPGIETFCW